MNKKKKELRTIVTRDTLLIDIIYLYPKVVDLLTNDYGFYCMTCPLAYSEKFGEGMQVHGLSNKEQDKLLTKINSLIKKN